MDLEELARLINERWPSTESEAPAVLDPLGRWLRFEDIYYQPRCSDMDNAEWLVWCLDRLEEFGIEPEMRKWHTGYAIGDFNDRLRWRGATRAEAVTNALYSKLKESVEPKIEDGNSK